MEMVEENQGWEDYRAQGSAIRKRSKELRAFTAGSNVHGSGEEIETLEQIEN
jgi:uncharacterized protein with WD repeat